jgi:hypothetical protein
MFRPITLSHGQCQTYTIAVIAERDRPPARERGGAADGAGDEFGRDGVSGLLSPDRAMRARDVSRPSEADIELAERIVDDLVARAEGRSRQLSHS